MAMKTKSASGRQVTRTIGRANFAKISAVEGIVLSRQMEEDFHEFDRRGLSAAERRAALFRKYGRQA